MRAAPFVFHATTVTLHLRTTLTGKRLHTCWSRAGAGIARSLYWMITAVDIMTGLGMSHRMMCISEGVKIFS